MARKKHYRIEAFKLHDAISKLRKLEAANSRLSLDGLSLSEHLINFSDYTPPEVAVPDLVKIEIQREYGVKNPIPSRLKSDTKMSKFSFGDADFIVLARSLTRIIRQYDPGDSVLPGELMECETVQECIDLIIEKCH